MSRFTVMNIVFKYRGEYRDVDVEYDRQAWQLHRRFEMTGYTPLDECLVTVLSLSADPAFRDKVIAAAINHLENEAARQDEVAKEKEWGS